MENDKPVATLFKALMHPARLEILEILREGEECVCHMEAHLGYRQAYISQHLMILREAGLVEDRRDGWNIFYHVTESRVFDLIDQARLIFGAKLEPTKPHTRHTRSSIPTGLKAPCPCPKCASSQMEDTHVGIPRSQSR